jgi:hypothetical protein
MAFGFGFLIRAEGGEADNGRVNLYDGAQSISGLARCLNLVAHAFANGEVVRTKGDNPKGVETFLHASKKGCFEERIDIEFSDALARRMGESVIQKNFWDYLLWSWSAAIGRKYDPVTPYVRKIESKKTPYGDEIADGLQSAMSDFHRLISEAPGTTIRLAKLRGPDELELNDETYQYVSASIRSAKPIYAYGNVTKYNILSGSGRYYDDKLREVVSFLLLSHKEKQNDEGLAVRSMEQRILGEEGKIRFRGHTIKTSRGVLKKFLVDSIELEKL